MLSTNSHSRATRCGSHVAHFQCFPILVGVLSQLRVGAAATHPAPRVEGGVPIIETLVQLCGDVCFVELVSYVIVICTLEDAKQLLSQLSARVREEMIWQLVPHVAIALARIWIMGETGVNVVDSAIFLDIHVDDRCAA